MEAMLKKKGRTKVSFLADLRFFRCECSLSSKSKLYIM